MFAASKLVGSIASPGWSSHIQGGREKGLLAAVVPVATIGDGRVAVEPLKPATRPLPGGEVGSLLFRECWVGQQRPTFRLWQIFLREA